MSFSAAAHDDVGSWRERALQRSLGDARERSEQRIHRLLGAARDLADETGSASFTVAQVAARAGLSLKTVYRCFAGKDELLLALLEEDSGIGAAILADRIGRHRDPVARVRAYIDGLFDMLTHPGAVGYAGVLFREHRRLGESHPDELGVALAPLVDLLAAQVESATEAGAADPGDAGRAARTVLGVALEGVGEVTLGRADPREQAAWVWRFCWSGLQGGNQQS